jgi:hypothetical protein
MIDGHEYGFHRRCRYARRALREQTADRSRVQKPEATVSRVPRPQPVTTTNQAPAITWMSSRFTRALRFLVGR